MKSVAMAGLSDWSQQRWVNDRTRCLNAKSIQGNERKVWSGVGDLVSTGEIKLSHCAPKGAPL